MFRGKLIRLSGAIVALGFVFATGIAERPAHAATFTWNPAATSLTWNTTSNWTPSGVPSSGSTVFFDGGIASGGTVAVNLGSFTANSLTLDNGAGFTLNFGAGSSYEYFPTVTVSDANNYVIQNNNGAADSFGFQSGTQTFNIASGGNLTLQGNFVVNNYSTTNIVKTGSGELDIFPTHFEGGSVVGVNVTGGILRLALQPSVITGLSSGLSSANGSAIYLSGSNSILSPPSGGITVSAGGTLGLNGVTSYNDNLNTPWSASGGCLNLINSGGVDIRGQNNVSVDTLTGNGNVYNSYSSGILTVGGNNGSSTFAGSMYGNADATGTMNYGKYDGNAGTLLLTKIGNGLLTLSGTNFYSGATQISSGTLQIGGGGVLNNGNYSASITNSGTLIVNTTSNQTFGGAISGNGSLIQAGSGILTLSSVSNTYSGSTTISGGILSIGAGTNLPSGSALTLANSGALNMTAGMTLANNVTIASGQSGTLNATGAFSPTLSGSYSNVAGTLVLNMSNASGYSGFAAHGTSGPTGTVSVIPPAAQNSALFIGNNSGPQGFLANANVVFPASGYCYVAGAGYNSQSFGALNGGNANVLIGFDNQSGDTVYINGTANGNFSGVIFNGYSAGANNLVMSGTAMQILSGANSYTGATTINGGTLAINGTLASGSHVAVNNAGTLGGSGLVGGPTTLTGNGAINLSGGTLGSTLGVTGGNWNGTGSVVGLVTSSSGLFTIGGANLAATAGLNLTGGTLAGLGTISGGTVTLGSGAMIAPATPFNTSVGTLTLPSLVTNGGGQFNIDLSASPTSGNDLIAVSNNLTLSGSSSLAVYPTGTLASGSPYTLFTYGGLLTYSGSNALVLASGLIGARQTATINYGSGTNSAVTLTINGFNANLTWVGTNSSTWADNGGSGPFSWSSTSSTNPNGGDFFTAGDSVTFNNTAGSTVVTLSGAVSPGSVMVTGSNSFTFSGSGSIQGSSGLTITGPGSLTITNTGNSYAGPTTIQGGTLVLGTSNALPATTTLVFGTASSAGTLNLAGYNQSAGSLAVGSGAAPSSQTITTSTGSSTLTYNGGGASSAYAGVVGDTAPSGGTLSLRVSSGTLDVSGGVTTYSGATTVNAGLLLANSLPYTSGISVGSAGALSLSGTNLSLPGVSNSGSVAFSGTSGTVTLASLNGGGTTSFAAAASFPSLSTGVVTVAGPASIASAPGGTANLNGATASIGTLGNAVLNLGSSTALSVSAGTQTAAGSITGGGSLTMTGSGMLALGGGNSYTGGTTLSSGVLAINSNSALGTGTFIIGGGSIDSTVASVTLANNPQDWNADFTFLGSNSLNVGSGSVALGSNRIVTVNANTLTAGGPISGTGFSLTKVGSGTLALSGVNTYSGGTTINGGVLSIGAAANLPSAGSLTLSGGVLNMTAGMTLANNVTIASGQSGTLSMANASVTLSGNYSSSAGTLVLDMSAATGYNGFLPTSNSGPVGTVSVLAVGQSQLGGAGTNFWANSILSLPQTGLVYMNGAGHTTWTFGALAGGSASTLIGFDNQGGDTFTIQGVANAAFGGTIFNGAGSSGANSLIKTGTSTQTFSGANTYSGGTTINGGVLQYGVANALLSSGSVNVNGASAVLDLGGFSATEGAFSLTNGSLQNGTLTATSYGVQNGLVSAALAGNGALTKNTAGLVTLTASNAYSGTTSINGGTLQLGSGSSGQDGSINSTATVINNGSLLYNLAGSQTASYTISGSGALAKTGSGLLNLSANNGYSGGSSISGGVLQLGNSAALGSGNLAANGGTLDLAGYSVSVPSFSGAAGVVTNSASADSVFTVNQSTATTFNGAIDDGPTNKVALVKMATGALTLSATNTYSGGTTLNNGVLVVTNPNSLGNSSGSLAIGNATLEVASGFSSPRNILSYSPSATFQVDAGIYNNAGTLSGTGGLIKTGPGTLLLAGAGTLGSQSNVNAGSLQIDGAYTLPIINVNGTAQLAGSGSVNLSSDGIVYKSSGSSTFAGTLSGGGGVEVDNGMLTLSGTANSYGGGTALGGGTLALGANNALPTATALTFGTPTSAGALDLAGNNQTVAGIALAHSGSWTGQTIGNSSQSSGATLTYIGGASTFGGTIQDHLGSGNQTTALTVSGGSLTLTAANFYSGPTTVQSGLLYLGASGAVPGAISVTGGTLDASAFAQGIQSVSIGSLGFLNLSATNLITSSGTDNFGGTLNILNFTSGTAELMSYASHTGTFAVNNLPSGYMLQYLSTQLDIVSSGPATWAAAVSGNWSDGSKWIGAVPNAAATPAVINASTTAAQTITLDVPVTLGTLTLGNSGDTSLGYTISGSGTNGLTLNNSGSGAAITVTDGTHEIDAAVTLNDNLTVTPASSAALTIGGNISQSGTQSLTLAGPGTLTLSGTNNFTGGTIVSNGTLILNNSEALADGSSLTVGDASAFAPVVPAATIAAGSGLSAPVITAVPEPGSFVLLVAGGLAALAVSRRRTKSAS